jgi:hypothetical protein
MPGAHTIRKLTTRERTATQGRNNGPDNRFALSPRKAVVAEPSEESVLSRLENDKERCKVGRGKQGGRSPNELGLHERAIPPQRVLDILRNQAPHEGP